MDKKNYTLRWLFHGKEPQFYEMSNTTLQSVQSYIKILTGWGCSSFKLSDGEGNEYEVSKFGTIREIV
jgi:hypothetical protein